jgi:hypothetical protein
MPTVEQCQAYPKGNGKHNDQGDNQHPILDVNAKERLSNRGRWPVLEMSSPSQVLVGGDQRLDCVTDIDAAVRDGLIGSNL